MSCEKGGIGLKNKKKFIPYFFALVSCVFVLFVCILFIAKDVRKQDNPVVSPDQSELPIISSLEGSTGVNSSEPMDKQQNFALVFDLPEKAKLQSEVVIPLNMENNPGVLGARLQILYDETAMELLSAERGDAFSRCLTMTLPGRFYSGCSFLWDGTELTESEIKDGEVLRLKFCLLKSGKFPLSVHYEQGDIIGADLEELSPETEDQFIVIQ